MGFKLKVEGPETVELGVHDITHVEFKTDTPKDSNARSTDLGSSLKVWGKVLHALDGKEDATVNLAKWSLVPSDKQDCYRNATVDVIAAGQVIRQINLPEAFVVDYQEEFDDVDGVGTFYLYMKQKKDQMPNLKLEGGFGGE